MMMLWIRPKRSRHKVLDILEIILACALPLGSRVESSEELKLLFVSQFNSIIL